MRQNQSKEVSYNVGLDVSIDLLLDPYQWIWALFLRTEKREQNEQT